MPGRLSASAPTEHLTAFALAHTSFCSFDRSALSVMGTWYVTVVVIIKYIWPDKEVNPGSVSTR